MTRQRIPPSRILGIPIGLDHSWFLIFGLLALTLASGYYPAEFKAGHSPPYWIVGPAQ